LKKRIIFLCTHNSARSQMAEGLLRHLKGSDYDAFSAGTEPTGVHPLAVKAMSEIGIDISKQTSKDLKEFIGQKFDLAVTLCDRARGVCPFFPGAKETVHRGFDDPATCEGGEEQRLACFRRVRDEIKDWIAGNFE